MGGYGSGYNGQKKLTVEQLERWKVTARALLDSLPTIPQTDRRVTLKHSLDNRHYQTTVTLTHVSTGRGAGGLFAGRRWYVVCPSCMARRTALYMWHGGLKCRECHNLAYTSTQESIGGHGGRSYLRAVIHLARALTYEARYEHGWIKGRGRAGSNRERRLLDKLDRAAAKLSGRRIESRKFVTKKEADN